MSKKENIVLAQEQDELQNKNLKQENKKASKKLYVLMLLAGIGGGIGGITMVKLNNFISGTSGIIKDLVTDFIYNNGYIFSMVMSAIMVALTITLALFITRSVKKAIVSAKMLMMKDNNDELEKIEKKQSINLWIANSLFILHFLFFTITIFMSKNYGGSQIQILIMTLIVTAVLLTDTLVIIGMQQKIVDLLRIMNPEKQGSIYDFKFNKKWEESSDEAELLHMYRAGYRAYKAIINFSIIMWGIFLFIGIGTGAGFFPAIIILLIWSFATCVYCYYSM